MQEAGAIPRVEEGARKDMEVEGNSVPRTNLSTQGSYPQTE